jgi:hypothetical protein
MGLTPFAKGIDRKLVYIKEIDTKDLPDDVRENFDQGTRVFAVHDADGGQLALVANRTVAFHLARENELVPVAVH